MTYPSTDLRGARRPIAIDSPVPSRTFSDARATCETQDLLPFICRVLKGDSYASIQKYLLTCLGHQTGIKDPASDLPPHMRNPEYLDAAAKAIAFKMRILAEMWIESGKTGCDRDVDDAVQRSLDWKSPGSGITLRTLLERLLGTAPSYHTIWRRDGKQEVVPVPPQLTDALIMRLGSDAAFQAYGGAMAAYVFLRLLDSPAAYCLSRCDFCSSFFAYQRARLRMVKRGVHCPACAGKASIKRTDDYRKRRLDTAAGAWIKWESRRKSQPEAEWIAEQVNKSHGTAFGRRWISQNLKEIQERVEAQNNAKGQSQRS